jgi:WD40 repeat protein
MSEGVPPILGYARADPMVQRLIRHLPRPSVVTVVLLLLAGISDSWFWQDHRAWVVEKSFERGGISLGAHVTSDGSRMLAGNGDDSFGLRSPFRILDTRDGREICRFGDNLEFASFAIFSPDEKRVLTVGGIIKETVTRSGNGKSTSDVWGDVRRTVRVWDAGTGTLLATLDPVGQEQSDLGSPTPVFYSPDGTKIVTLQIERAKLYDGDGKKLGDLEKREGYGFVTDRVYFSPDSRLCVVRTVNSNTIRFRSTTNGSVTAEHVLENTAANGFEGAFSPDGKTFACVCFGWLYLIDPADGSLRQPPISVGGNESGIWYSADGKRVLLLVDKITAGGAVATLFIAVDNTSGKIVASAPTTADVGTRITEMGAAHEISLSIWDSRNEIHDAASLTLISTIASNGISRFSRDQSRYACLATNGALRLLSTADWRQTGEIDLPAGAMEHFTDAMFLADRDHVLTTTDKGTVQRWMRRRPEPRWGVIALPMFWVAVVFTLGLIFSVGCDMVKFGRRGGVG